MKTSNLFRTPLLLFSLVVWQPFATLGRSNFVQPQTSAPAAAPRRDGQRDFDFHFGLWKTHLKRLLHPLTGSNAWVEYEGTTLVRKIWDGRANLVELEADGPAGHIEGLSLRLYNPETHQWNLNFANSTTGTLSPPTIGEFRQGRGEFFDQETVDGRGVLVRFLISDITSNSCHFEQSFSDDGGKTWEVNWIATDTRLKDESQLQRSNVVKASHELAPAERGQRDFDFEEGSWKIHLSRLDHPLTGSTKWTEFDGTTVTQKVWGGRAFIEEFESDSPSLHIEGLTLRLYNPQSHQWSLNWATSRTGTLSIPTIGEFKNGRGEFYDHEPINGRMILVRFIWSEITANSAHFEQSFSDDGGKTWEANWITNQTRVKDQ
jgi:hypothetical protein